MNFILFLEFVLIFNTINGDPKPLLIEHDLSGNGVQPPSSRVVMPKTIVISGMNGEFNTEDPNIIEAVMNAVNNELRSDDNEPKDVVKEVPEIIIDSEQKQSVVSPNESIQKVYKLPALTRMISSEEETDNKKSRLWRSPLPFLHPEECSHHKRNKKSKSYRKKSRKQPKKTVTEPVVTTTTVKPTVVDTTDNNPFESFGSLLTSIISRSVLSPEGEPQPVSNDMKGPTSFGMSFSHRILRENPEISSESKPPLFMAVLHKRFVPHFEAQPEPQPLALPSMPLLLSLLSRSEEPMEPIVNFRSNKEPETHENDYKKEITNYNFNVNLTINNNYLQPEAKPFSDNPFSLLFK